MEFEWNVEKNELLRSERGLSFDMVVKAINSGGLLNDGPHPDAIRYPHQQMYVVLIDGYVCMVPYVRSGDRVFLKTIFRNRKINRRYAGDL